MSKENSPSQNQKISQEEILKRKDVINQLGLSIHNNSQIFTQATQTVAYFLKIPICILDILVEDELIIQSAFGLFTIGLMNDLTRTRKMSSHNSLSFHVIETKENLVIENIESDSIFAQHILTQEYGICSYVGVPLITPEGICLGTLAVMDVIKHSFTPQDIQFLMVTARWCLIEYIYTYQKNNNQLLSSINEENSYNILPNSLDFINNIKLEILEYFTEDLKNPLTSIMGMTSVLKQGVYGEVSEKQKEYLKVIHDSGEYLVSKVSEIIKLGEKSYDKNIKLATFDVEMLSQQVLNKLKPIAKHYQQKLSLSIEPGKRIWSLYKEKIQASLFYLILTIIESAEPDGEVKLHFSRKKDTLNFSIWLSHPWLDDGLPSMGIHSSVVNYCLNLNNDTNNRKSLSENNSELLQHRCHVTTSHLKSLLKITPKNKQYRQLLELFLSCFWIESHHGKMIIHGFSNLGYRYVLSIPKIEVKRN